jgi:hypothetical protein
VTGLLPDVVRHGVQSRSIYAASESFGVVTLVLLLALLIEWQVLELRNVARPQFKALFAFALPLLLAVGLTIASRIEHLH